MLKNSTGKLNLKCKNNKRERGVKTFSTLMVIMISSIILCFGITGIIENISPTSLSSLTTLVQNFTTYFEDHVLIAIGAFGYTFAAWLMIHH